MYRIRRGRNFSGYNFQNNIANGQGYALAKGPNNKIGLVYIANTSTNPALTLGSVYFMESQDNGSTWGNPVPVWVSNFTTDNLACLKSVDVVYQGIFPKVIFNLCKQDGTGVFFPGDSSKLVFWSPNINNGNPLEVDEAPGLNGSNPTNDVFVSVCRGVIGVSSDNSILYTAYNKARTDQSPEGNNFFDVYFTYSTDGGLNWSTKIKVTNNSGPLRDCRYVAISPFNNLTSPNNYFVHLIYQQDSIAGSFVNGSQASLAKMMYSRINLTAAPSYVPTLITPANGATNISVTPVMDWSDVPTAPKYWVQISTDSLFSTYVLKDSTSILSQFSVPTGILNINTKYFWRVYAKNTVDWGNPSLTFNFTTISSSLEEGLVGYYPFNGNANDQSSSNNNGTVYNAALTTDRFGIQNSAYEFNGTNAYIKASANPLPTSVRTISLWFYAFSLVHPVLFAYGGNESCGYSYWQAINVTNHPGNYMTSSHCEVNNVLYNYTTSPLGQWYHWIVVASSTDTKFYLNGSLVTTQNVVYNTPITNNTDLAFGVCVGGIGIAPYTDGNVAYFHGKLDDIRIYNRELNSAEILTLYNEFQPIKLNLKVLMEGMYYTSNNWMLRNDTAAVYLRNASSPYSLADSAKVIIDKISFSGSLNFWNAPSGTYYLVVKHHNCIETWSKAGGELLVNDGSTYNYDFTNSITKAYGNNLKLKGASYCMFSGDVDNSGTVDLTDVIQIYNDANNFVTGYAVTDLTGNDITDLQDIVIAYNNSSGFVCVMRP